MLIEQLSRASEIARAKIAVRDRLIQRSLRRKELAISLIVLRLIKRRIDLRKHLSGVDVRIVIDRNFRNEAGNLSAHLNGRYRFHITGCFYITNHATGRDHARSEAKRQRYRFRFQYIPQSNTYHRDERKEQPSNFSISSLTSIFLGDHVRKRLSDGMSYGIGNMLVQGCSRFWNANYLILIWHFARIFLLREIWIVMPTMEINENEEKMLENKTKRVRKSYSLFKLLISKLYYLACPTMT